MKTSKISSYKEKVSTVRRASQLCLAAVLAGLIGLNWATVVGPAQPSGNDTSGAEVLTRGPVHEAFAGVVTFNPEPGVVINKAPPEVIEEMPPAERPEGDNVAWIPGYWSWDDERNDFLWISGTWRVLPPGRQWIAGYWAQTPQGHQWISGYWADTSARETTYLPPPPATLEVGANIPAPSADYIWAPGCWIWYHGHYAWRPGYWARCRPDWDWIPSYYVCTPRGYVFIDGYWDYPVYRRGIVFAPVYFEPRVYVRRGYIYSPSIVISLNVFSDHLFLRPRYCHYYFGDYYAPSYYQGGFYASFSFHSSRHGYDPFYSRARWEHRNERDWERRVETSYHHRRDHETARPPRTWAAQRSISPSTAETGENRMLVAAPIEQVANRREGGMRFQSVAQTERQEITVRSREVQKVREERRTIESRVSAPTPSQPGEAVQPATAQLPKSPIVGKAANRMGRNLAPPEVPRAPEPDLKRQPRSEPAARPQNVERNQPQPQPEVRQPEPGKQLPPGRSQTTPRERPVQPEVQPRPSRERESRPREETERTPPGLEKKAPRESEARPDDSAVRVREESQRNVRAQEQQAQEDSDRRAKNAAAQAAEESQRNAQALEKKTKQDPEQRANDAAARAREESQRNIRAQEQRSEQQESERRAKDATARAAEESQRNVRAQQAQQQESERRARDAAVKAREDSQRNARSAERQTPPPAQPRANPVEKAGGPDKQQVQPQQQQPPRVSEPPTRGKSPSSEKGATRLREYDRQKEDKGKP